MSLITFLQLSQISRSLKSMDRRAAIADGTAIDPANHTVSSMLLSWCVVPIRAVGYVGIWIGLLALVIMAFAFLASAVYYPSFKQFAYVIGGTFVWSLLCAVLERYLNSLAHQFARR